MTTTEAPKVEFYSASTTDLKAVNVLVMIDAETILNTFPKGTAASPTQITDPDKYITMMVRQNNVLANQKGSELSVTLDQGENIRWRETTLSLNSEYISILYMYQTYGPDNKVISKPQALILQELKVPLPNRDDPTNPTIQTINDFFWQATALKKGYQDYNFRFMILNRKGEKLGYYYWDPKVTVT